MTAQPEPPITGRPVPAATAAILDDIPGFARGTVGGRNGTLYEVTTLDDDGPGSLRDALESPDPLWIVFQAGSSGTIRIESRIYVESYKTVDARGHEITLKAVRDDTSSDPGDGWNDTSVSLGRSNEHREIRDVAFINLTFDGSWPEPDTDGEGADGIHLHNDVHHVWIHRCTFHNWIDGAIDARVDEGYGTLPRDISITESHFYDIHQGLLLEASRVTFARNHCDNVNSRCVKTIDGGSAHVVNNVLRNWRHREIVFAKGESQILVDHNIFEPGSENDEAGRTEGPGDVQDLHNVHHRSPTFRMRDRGRVDPAFKTEAQDAYGRNRKVDCEHDPPDRTCWNQLYDDVLANAGANN